MTKFIKILIAASCLLLFIALLLLAYTVFTPQKPITSTHSGQEPAKPGELQKSKEKETDEGIRAIPPRNLPKKINF